MEVNMDKKLPVTTIFYLVISLLTILTTQKGIFGVQYGPSLASLTGVFVNWKGPDLFAIESGRIVKLENYPGYAAVIPLISGESRATSEQIFQERGISTVGEFVVEAPKGFGVIVVIQELRLRKTSRDRGNNNGTISCSDYIQFGETKSDSSGSKTSKICGTVNKDDMSINPPGLLGERTFRTTTHRMRIAFNHAYVAELVDSLLGNKQRHSLRAEISFTAYKANFNCSDELMGINSNSTSGTDIEYQSYESCSDYKNSANQTCISSKLLCDDIYNCGGDESLGSDDSATTCPDKPVRTTEIPSKDDSGDILDVRQDGLSNLATYLGIPALSSYPTKKYERKFRPSYVSSHQSSGSGFGFDYTSRRTSEISSTSTTESLLSSVALDSDVAPAQSKNVKSVGNSQIEALGDEDTEIYNRRELSHAINSVIYGVAVFIIFTIFITVFVVCLTKKIQMTWTARAARRNSADAEANRRRVSTPSIIPNTTTTVITHNTTGPGCIPTSNGEIVFGPQNRTVVLLTLPQSVETYDLPPSYDTLFPVSSSRS